MTAQKKPSVLIAGGSSFLALKLASSLLSQNCKVTIIDDIQDLPKNLKDLQNLPDFKFEKVDFTQKLPETPDNFTHIYHLIGVDEYFKGTKPTLKDLVNNSYGTENLLKLAKETVAKFVLVSTLDVYAGVISQTSLESYFGPTKLDFSHYSHHEAKRFAESLTAAYFQNYRQDLAIARVAQVYGPGMDLTSAEIIPQLISQAVNTEQITIEGSGLEILHPTYVDDVVWGLVKIGFSKNTKGGIYNLVNSDEVTVLEFGQKLKEICSQILPDKKLEIKFEEKQEQPKFAIPKIELAKTEQELGWKPKIDLLGGLKTTLEFFVKEKPAYFAQDVALQAKEEEVKPQPEKQEEVVRVSQEPKLPKKTFSLPKIPLATFSLFKFPTFKLNLTYVLLIIILLLLALPFGQIFYGGVFSFKNFQDIKSALAASDFSRAEKEAREGKQAAKIAVAGFKKLKPAFMVTGQSQNFEKFNQNFEGVFLAFSGVENLMEAVKVAGGLARASLSGEDGVFDKISPLDLTFTQAVSDLTKAGVFLQSSAFGKLPFIGEKIKTANQEFEKNLPGLKKIAKLVKLLPEILATDGQKSYLVLFLNNGELRPGGGFIGSYANFNFVQGKLTPPQVDDIYNLDGQLKVQIAPPTPLKDHLGVGNLGLRDSNWHYDFAQNGQTARALYQTITGKTVDGVISMDVTAVASLLKILGPIKLSDYAEEITADNLAERAEYYSEINFFPGSTGKKDFLGAVARSVILKLQEGENVNYFEVLKTLTVAASEKHLNFYFSSENLENFVVEVGWSGKIKSITEQVGDQTRITTDFLALSEANVGANKANRFLRRKIKLSPIILRDGDLITKVEINYENTSPAPTWPGGNYKNYLRLITPVSSKLEQFKIGEEDVTTRVEQAAEGDKQIWAVFSEVPAGESKLITVTFRPNYRIEITGNNAAYSLLVQKQPGTVSDAVEIDLSYPGYLKAVNSAPNATFSEQKVNFAGNLAKDLNFRVEFSL